MDESIKKWLEFYYGTADVPPSKIADSLSSYRFAGLDRFPRNQADRANNTRVLAWAKKKGLSDGDEIDYNSIQSVNKELADLHDKARTSAWVDRDESALLSEIASPQRGFDSTLDSKPSLAYGGVREDVAADGYMMLIGHGAKDFLSKQVFGKKNLKEVGSESLIKKNVAESTFPDYKALIPRKDRLTRELRVVGTGYNGQQGGFDLFLSDGEGLIGVQANKFAWLREKLPNAKVYGSMLVEQNIRKKGGELIQDEKGDLIWDETITNKLDPGAPVSFVVDGKTVGILMPLYYAKGWGKKSLEDSTFPDVIKNAVGYTVRGGVKSDKVTELQTIHDSRSELSQSSDERQEHSVVVEPDDPAVERWLKDSGRMDVHGIDTPRKRKIKNLPKARPKKKMDVSLRQIRG